MARNESELKESSQFSYGGPGPSYEVPRKRPVDVPSVPPPVAPPPPFSSAQGGYGAPYGGFPYGGAPLPSVSLVRQTLTRRNWMWLVVVTALVAAVVGAVIGAAVGLGSQQTEVEQFFPNHSVLVHPTDIQAVLAKVEPAVVSITSHGVARGGSTNGDYVVSAGSGMILTPEGEVLTNNHVVTGATVVSVTLFGQTEPRAARVVGTDPLDDLALLQIDNGSHLPTVTLGNSDASRVGDSVLAIGNALALAGGPSVTQGIVSAKNRSLSAVNDRGQAEHLIGLIQTDAAINPGNSGGPLVNAQAQVIGMNTAVASSSSGNAPAQNIGFAIGIDSVKPRLNELRQGGPGGGGNSSPAPAPVANAAYMGVTVETVTSSLQQRDQLTPSTGALVTSVQAGSPAASAGVKVGDVIVSFNAVSIETAEDLTAAIHPLAPGDHVKVGIYRGSTSQTIEVTLGATPGAG